MRKQKNIPSPTEEQFNALNGAYKYFNRVLFGNKLPNCMLNFSRKKNTHGFLAPERWRRIGSIKHNIHEISLTPTTLYRTPIEIFSTLVHEQAHLWQWEFGSPSRNGYHNKEWADKMMEVGLIPSDTGKEGGKKTGQNMTHLIEKEGRYEKAFQKMAKKYTLPFTSLEGDLMKSLLKGIDGKNEPSAKLKRLRPPSRKKTKYTCPNCKCNVWGKPELKLICGECDSNYQAN